MPLTTGELDRIRAELGANLLDIGAEPYIGVQAVFSQVIAPYLREGADTTSSTAVEENPRGAFVTLTLASTEGVVLHERLAVDVDDYLEMATVRSVRGNQVGVILKKMHVGTYPVTVDGGLQKVRECLSGIYNTHLQIAESEATGSIKSVDEVHFYDTKGRSQLQLLNERLEHWRDQLASALGIPRRRVGNRNGGACALF